jgi:hypothetical protein
MEQDQGGPKGQEKYSLEGYREHNDGLAKKYGEPGHTVVRALEEARQHLRTAEKRLDVEGQVSELHLAVASLLRAVEKLHSKEIRP